MPHPIAYRPLWASEQRVMVGQGCTSSDWSAVRVEDGFDPVRVRNVRFEGQVSIGRYDPAATSMGLYNACIVSCRIGRNVRIVNVGSRVAHYDIGDGACIEDVGLMTTRSDAMFGNGVEVAVLNEAGGRQVIIFNAMSAQFAYLYCVHRHRAQMIDRLASLAHDAAAQVRSSVGSIGVGAVVRSVTELVDVNVEAHAEILGASRLVNGTVLSSQDAATVVGADVQAEDFIIAEGASVTGGVALKCTFVGQGCRIGKQFSAEHSLFFANCEAFHGEAVSLFAGPYTVTHHKSTLLIAGLFSFYNAGSGTNQSNHMYKLGPVHEGKIERGSKMGSFSYLCWPCRVGPFSVVLGKHTQNFDTSNLPFSLIYAAPDGRCTLVPGLNLTTVGTVRDGAKWPSRDRRIGGVKRDLISFDVFSPYTVGSMIKGRAILRRHYERSTKQVDSINLQGAKVQRALLRTGQRSYQSGIEMYLLEQVFSRAERALAAGQCWSSGFATDSDAMYSEDWLDIGGQLMPRNRLESLAESLSNGELVDIDAFAVEVNRIADAYNEDEWVWVKHTFKKVFDRDIEEMLVEDIIVVANSLLQVRIKFLKLVLADAKKEFSSQIRTGFGHDGNDLDIDEDFRQVRGSYENNEFVNQIQGQIAALNARVEQFKEVLTNDKS